MPQFMLILYRTREMQRRLANFSPDQMKEARQKYMAWAKALQARGQYDEGESLAHDSGKILALSQSELEVTDGPYLETKEIVGGYFLVKAPDYATACQLTESCPQLALGGVVEIREVDSLGEDSR